MKDVNRPNKIVKIDNRYNNLEVVTDQLLISSVLAQTAYYLIELLLLSSEDGRIN